MSSTELQFEHPWLLLLAIPAFLLILLPFFRLPGRLRNTPKRLISTGIHLVVVLLLTLVLAGMSIVRSTGTQAVILLVDASDSTLSVREEMWDTAQRLRRSLGKSSFAGTVVFGGDCAYAENISTRLSPERTDATDLGGALEYAAQKLPADKVGRIILLSDGKQTNGNADTVAQYLQTQGIRIDAVYFHTPMSAPEAQISRFSGPEGAYTGRPVTFTVELDSTEAAAGTLTLYDGDSPVTTIPVGLQEGTTVLEISAQASDAGLHTYRLTLDAEADTESRNNLASACVQVAQCPSVLIISGFDTDASALQSLLEKQNTVEILTASSAPRTIERLCDYDGVILLNASADDLPKTFASLAEEYVRVYGRSLLAVGGTNTFMYGSMRDTPLEEMMPVNFSLSRTSQDDSVALMLVMDCSLSMSQQSTFLSVAKQGSIKCIEAMTANDYVGIISFNQTAVVEAPLAQNTPERKSELNRIISGLTTSQGTYYTDALALARQELLSSNAPVRHILFVSDGGPADSTYQQILPQLVNDGITLSTIGLGYSSPVLSNMAQQCGGSHYFVKEATDLPDIMLTLTKQISVNSLMTGRFTPVVAEQTELTAGIPAILPGINGYLGTTLKRGAQAPIAVEGHPLYATWQYGAGTVSCFTSDMGQAWCSSWLSGEAGPALFLRFTEQTLPDIHRDSSLTAQVTPLSNSILLEVTTATTDPALLTVSLEDVTREIPRVGTGVYRISLPASKPGSYSLLISQSNADGTAVDTLECFCSLSGTAEYDAFAEGGQALLSGICAHSGGAVTDDISQLTKVDVETISIVSDFRVLFGILIALALLSDIAVRKLRWKDLQNILLILKNR